MDGPVLRVGFDRCVWEGEEGEDGCKLSKRWPDDELYLMPVKLWLIERLLRGRCGGGRDLLCFPSAAVSFVHAVIAYKIELSNRIVLHFSQFLQRYPRMDQYILKTSCN